MTEDVDGGQGLAQLPVAPAHTREAVLAELATVAPFVAGLTAEDWKKPSACAGWTIGDVVVHLNLALGLYGRLLDAVMSGHGSGSVWKAFGRLTQRVAPAAAPAFNALNSTIPRLVSGALAPEVVMGQFAAAVRTYRARVEKVGPQDYTRPVYYMGAAWPLSTFLAATLNELAVHGWDMRSPLDPQAHLSEDARAILPWFYWGASTYMLHLPAGPVGSIQATITDPNAAMWWTLGGPILVLGAGEHMGPDAKITGESGTFVLVLAGRISADDALRTTSITISGNESLGRQFLGGWKIT